jgi:predicted enzyme related to lactoylglutathione lyase
VADKVHFERSQPILRVEDMQRALHFYLGKLGFKKAEWSTNDFAMVERDGASMYLCRSAQGKGGAWVWLGVDDARKLHEQLKAAGAKIILPPTNYQWALEFQVEDPDGNVLRLGSEPE